ncbi:MAG: hypothetical protein JSU96_06155 [Acidobacteriota bacterium]|nr:MAG: hypothetical protein JSU96_06155 [Acidobacteriota bacterium]
MSPDYRLSTRDADSGFGMLELLASVVVITIALLAMGQFMVVTIDSGSASSYRVEVLNQVRAKIEDVKSIPYDQLGISTGNGDSGPGYFETDPFYNPTFGQDDLLLSDTVELSHDGTTLRTVTIQAVDDASDDTGKSDWDGVTDPNTESILDYKLVTVSIDATEPTDGSKFTVELSTLVIGSLESEVDGAGNDTDTAIAKKSKKARSGKGKKKTRKQSNHDTKKNAKNKKGRDSKSDDTAESSDDSRGGDWGSLKKNNWGRH